MCHLASIVFFGVLPAVILVAVLVTAIADDSDRDRLPAVLPRRAGHPRRRQPVPGAGRAPDGVRAPVGLSASPGAARHAVDAASDVGRRSLVMVSLVPVAARDPVRSRCRDWRCYGVILLWPPVISAIQTGKLTLWLALAAALAWRFRDRVGVPSASVGSTLAVKFLLWPLVVWLAATRRWASAVWPRGIGCALLLASWAVIGFDGYDRLPGSSSTAPGRRRRRLVHARQPRGRSRRPGRSGSSGRGSSRSWCSSASGLVARRGDERSAFILALAASLALTPLVWLHYFALLITVVAVARRRPRPRVVRSARDGRVHRRWRPDAAPDVRHSWRRGGDGRVGDS